MNHRDIVQAVKADLEARRVPLSGSCGAFRILYGVAIMLNASDPRRPWGFLLKTSGNRAVPQPDGTCLSGGESDAPGYATDYLIERDNWFGYDVLGDGGGANTPQWPDEPETAPDIVARNAQHFRSPPPWPGWGGVPPVPPPDGPPIDGPPVLDPSHAAALLELVGVVRSMNTTLGTIALRYDALSAQLDDVDRRIFGTKTEPGLTLTGKVFGFETTFTVPKPKP